MSILNRLPHKEVLKYAKTVWASQATAEKIASDALEIVKQASEEKFSFFTGKSSKGLLGSLFYLLGIRYDALRTQKELARKIGTTEATIRILYRKWLEEFPVMFQDITGKPEETEELGGFVRSRCDKRDDFDRLLSQTIDEMVRYCLGETSARLIYKYLAKKGCPKDDIPGKLDVFVKVFENLVGFGKEQIPRTQVIEEAIVRAFSAKLKVEFTQYSPGYFPDKIRKLKDLYDQRKSKSS